MWCSLRSAGAAAIVAAAVHGPVVAAPILTLTQTFALPSTIDSIRVDLSGNPYIASLPELRWFFPSDANSTGLTAGTCNSSGFGADNRACIYNPATGAFVEDFGGPAGAFDINEAGEMLWGLQDPRIGNQTISLIVRMTDGSDVDLGFTSYRRPSFNNKHDVVGRNLGQPAFYVFDDVTYELESLVTNLGGFHIHDPTDLNDRGYIAGWGTYGPGEFFGFVLAPVSDDTPVPSPGTPALVYAAIAIAASITRGARRRCSSSASSAQA